MSNQTAAARGKKTRTIVITAAVLVAAAIIGLVAFTMFGSQRTVKSTLQGYFNALYCETLINNMTPYLVEDIRQICYDDFTFYGTTVGILRAYQEEKMELVGANLALSVKIDSESSGTAAALNSASDAYGASALMDVVFTVTFSGSEGEADFSGIARLVKVSGKWYLTEYNLPLTEKS